GVDHTEGMQRWATGRLAALATEGLCGFIFKSRSPSSGMTAVKVYDSRGVPTKKGVGIFARAFMTAFPLVPVEDDGRLHDPVLRENFLERVFVYHRWRTLMEGEARPRDLVAFHTHHKYLIMSHSPQHLSRLGKLVAAAGDGEPPLLAYLEHLMAALRLVATPRKHANVLTHLLGYCKRVLTADEKQELLENIERYRQGYLPRVVPITLINHYVRKYDIPYLKEQVYLNPHPRELMLMNHC
ncbi:MAG: YbgA family protein, partial [Syntrophales bacterium]|nr:YbgA family protein [Syntrophales bacterium]